MQLKTILNRVERHKGFVYDSLRFGTCQNGEDRIEVLIRPRRNGKPVCSCCGRKCATYDQLCERCFEYAPLWKIFVVFLYCMRRVNCPRCGVKVERVPWSAYKSPLTRSLVLFLADWAKTLSRQEMAGIITDPAEASDNVMYQNGYLGSPGGRIAGGTDEIMLNIIAERVLGLPQDIRVDKKVPFNQIPTGGG